MRFCFLTLQGALFFFFSCVSKVQSVPDVCQSCYSFQVVIEENLFGIFS